MGLLFMDFDTSDTSYQTGTAELVSGADKTGNKKQSEERAALFADLIHAIVRLLRLSNYLPQS